MAKKKGARAKLREHFLSNIGRIMASDELREVAGGITEWARRVRELRTEEGYLIQTHNDRSDLKPGQYILDNPIPQPAFERAKKSTGGKLLYPAVERRCIKFKRAEK